MDMTIITGEEEDTIRHPLTDDPNLVPHHHSDMQMLLLLLFLLLETIIMTQIVKQWQNRILQRVLYQTSMG
jgi:hypothetical protein